MTYYFYPIRRPWHEHTMPDMVDRIRKEMNLTYTVPVDVISAADHYEITALLPGVKTEDLNVNVVNDTVTIEGKFTANRDEKAEYLLKELPDGKFTRTLRFSEELNAARTEATMEDGILKVTVAKAEAATPKQIKVVSK